MIQLDTIKERIHVGVLVSVLSRWRRFETLKKLCLILSKRASDNGMKIFSYRRNLCNFVLCNDRPLTFNKMRYTTLI
ncbi:hypothetical protein V1478_008010 [Vespula squamosa]|uniref:Uncharacterized protein n=1 Tax=Vespula squamosa TaxID=30214 RepID=A0ABD2AXJ9_VESSQ